MKVVKKQLDNLEIENARITYRNFSGAEGKFNPKGRRNFCVFIDDELAKTLIKDGWNVRFLKPRDEDEMPQPYLQIIVNFDNVPPKIILLKTKKKVDLTEDSVGILDWAEIVNVDLIIKPYIWEVNGKSGVKGYLKSMYVTIEEDRFESKYYDVPDSAASAL